MRKPPTTGPNAAATPAVAPQAANAVARSRPWNVVDRIASVDGSINDAPMPSMIASPRMSCGTDVETDATSEPTSEQRGADDEDAAVPVDVAEAAADDEQRGERERVAGDHPQQRRQRGVEVGADRGDRDVEHRVVEHHDERGQQHDERARPNAADRAARGGATAGRR